VVQAVKNIPAEFAPTLDYAVTHLESNLQSGDVVLVLSAGDAIQINKKLLQSPRFNNSKKTFGVKK
jgi:UDP-N-acetylmuramate-alanine ligase